jgi:hypothetical protein
MSSMRLTPMSTLVNVVQQFCTNPNLSGVTAEISGEKATFRDPPDWVDDITRENIAMFSKLGYA